MSSSSCRKKRIRLSKGESLPDPFDALPDDLVICILSKLCSSSSSPSNFINALLVCKRFKRLGLNPLVLSKASTGLLSIRAKNWSDSAHQFVKQCVQAGSVEACYFLGMIRFYCLKNRVSGASLMAKAAIRCHTQALYSLAVIQFNGSGGTKTDKDLRAGVSLCVRAAYFGHIDARRELGHCLQDGYGVRRNVAEGRRLLIQANARELATVLPGAASISSHRRLKWNNCSHRVSGSNPGRDPGHGTCPVSSLECALLSDFGCNVPMPQPHPANRFLIEWFGLRGSESDPGLGMCSHSGCGRPETRPHEFRKCSMCGAAKYCSRGCQAHDWKLRHKAHCAPVQRWGNAVNGDPLVAVDAYAAEDVVVVES